MKEFEVGKRLYRHGIINTIATLLAMIFMNVLALAFLINFLFAEEGVDFIGLLICAMPVSLYALYMDVQYLCYKITWVDEYEDCMIGYRWLRPVDIPFSKIEEFKAETYEPWYYKHPEYLYSISFKDASWDKIKIPRTSGTDGLVERWREKYLPKDTTSFFKGYAYEESREPTGIYSAGNTELRAEIGQDFVKITGVRAGDELKTYTPDGILLVSETVSRGNTAKLTLPAGSYIVKVSQSFFNVYGDKATTDYSYELTVK